MHEYCKLKYFNVTLTHTDSTNDKDIRKYD